MVVAAKDFYMVKRWNILNWVIPLVSIRLSNIHLIKARVKREWPHNKQEQYVAAVKGPESITREDAQHGHVNIVPVILFQKEGAAAQNLKQKCATVLMNWTL